MKLRDSPDLKIYLFVALVLTFLLALPSLQKGFNSDDLLIVSMIEETYPERANSFDIYSTLFEHLQLPWWSGDEVRSSFFRPVSGLLLRIDHALFGRHALLWRLHSLAWLVLLLVLAQRIYRRGFPVAVGGMALIWLALDESLAFTAGWIANRHALVAATFGCAALVAHRRWRRDGWSPGAVLAVLAYAASLASGETGLAFLGYGFCFEIFGRRAQWRSRLAGASITVALLVAYVGLYKILGYGTRGGSVYVDPASEPLRFLAAALYRIPLNLAGLLLAIPPDPIFSSRFGTLIVSLGVAATLVFGLLAFRLWKSWPEDLRRELAWCLTGAFLSLVPLAAVIASHRQLLSPMIGVAPFLAAIAWSAWTWLRTRRGIVRWGGAALAAVLCLAHFLVAPAARLAMEQGLDMFHQSIVTPAAELPTFDEPTDLVLLKVPGLPFGLYGRTFYDDSRPVPAASWSYLSTAQYDHVLTRVDEHTLELSLPEGEMLTGAGDLFWSRKEELQEGRIFSTDVYDAEILELGDEGPVRVRFNFHRSPDRDDVYLGAWIDGTWVAIELPEPGDSVRIEHVGDVDSILGT